MSVQQPPSNETVLLVHDDVLVRAALADYLRECGYRVVEAVSIEEALVVLKAEERKIDVVFSDVGTGGTMDGFAFARWVKEHHPELDILLAGSPRSAAEKAADLCESGPQLAKPYDHQALHNHIRALLAGRSKTL
jgi:DNA-binding response OmpR family regulator